MNQFNQYPVLKNHVTISLAVKFSFICFLQDLIFWINYYVIGQKLFGNLLSLNCNKKHFVIFILSEKLSLSLLSENCHKNR